MGLSHKFLLPEDHNLMVLKNKSNSVGYGSISDELTMLPICFEGYALKNQPIY